MFGAHHRGFAWKEIAKALHMTRAVARATFWREIKRSRSKSVEAQPPAIVIQYRKSFLPALKSEDNGRR
jgi:hypothetical protein